MQIELQKIAIRDMVAGYKDSGENGVVGYGGQLDIRPGFQREFIYKDKQRDAVVTTVTRDFPLNVMYWAVRDDGTFEIIDGQQRTISICQYVAGVFSHQDRFFHNLRDDEQRQILDYQLTVYVCSGPDSERLDWFRTVNIAGEELTAQELRNAVYAGSWVSDAKRYFSKRGCAAYQLGGPFLKGSPIRQDYLETAIRWVSRDAVAGYMAEHQHEQNANGLWRYFQDVITWVKGVFPVYRGEMKGVAWGPLYNEYKDGTYDAEVFEKGILALIDNDDVQSIRGIYPYILTGDERHLNLRQFDGRIKRRVFERQGGKCEQCRQPFPIEEMEADHITPWSLGGRTVEDNCQVLCKEHNRRKAAR